LSNIVKPFLLSELGENL